MHCIGYLAPFQPLSEQTPHLSVGYLASTGPGVRASFTEILSTALEAGLPLTGK
jgi:hypothetical protein